ncbi:universal stress protein UspA-like protein [Prauserella sp. Am3]|nr:universal stress protein UspA-like protein [Prauserella sp. Am3]
MTEIVRSSGPVVAATDGSEAALQGVRWAARAAAMRGAPLQILHASGYPERYTGESILPPDTFKAEMRRRRWEFLHEAREAALDEVAGLFDGTDATTDAHTTTDATTDATTTGAATGAHSGVDGAGARRVATAAAGRTTRRLEVHTLLDPEQPIPCLVRASERARLLVLGTSAHRGITGLIVGSTTIALVAHSRGPVVSVRGADGAGGTDRRPVVVGVDGSPLSERALGHAFDEASFRGVALVAVHTWSDADTTVFSQSRMHFDWEPVRDTEERSLAERLAGWRERYPDVPVERVLVKDKPRHELIEWSTRAQLVVVGSRGRGGFRGMLLGSTSHALIHNAGCPVMIARPEPETTDT